MVRQELCFDPKLLYTYSRSAHMRAVYVSMSGIVYGQSSDNKTEYLEMFITSIFCLITGPGVSSESLRSEPGTQWQSCLNT